MTHGQLCVESGCEDECAAVEKEPSCVPGLKHVWSAAGGIQQNPGVWSLGGTRMGFRDRCAYCGTLRLSVSFGCQRSPEDCDTVAYEIDAYPVDQACLAEGMRRARRAAAARLRRARLKYVNT